MAIHNRSNRRFGSGDDLSSSGADRQRHRASDEVRSSRSRQVNRSTAQPHTGHFKREAGMRAARSSRRNVRKGTSNSGNLPSFEEVIEQTRASLASQTQEKIAQGQSMHEIMEVDSAVSVPAEAEAAADAAAGPETGAAGDAAQASGQGAAFDPFEPTPDPSFLNDVASDETPSAGRDGVDVPVPKPATALEAPSSTTMLPAAAPGASGGIKRGRGRHSVAKGEASDYSRDGASGRYAARRGRSTGKKVAIAVAVILVFALAGAGIAFGVWYNTVAGNLAGDKNLTSLTEAEHDKPYYVLLLGGDSRQDTKEDNRTDSIMVARVDEPNKSVNLISVPRDLRIYIEGHGYCKINSAIEYGGYDGIVHAVNDILGIKVNYYAFIYFSGFKDLVDKLGGVRVDVPVGTYYNGTWVQAGEDVLIDGKEALVLARCRHGYPPDEGAYAMGDYQRTLNQRNLIKAIAKTILQKDPSELPGLIEGLSSCVETNMGISQLIATAQNMKGFDTDSLQAAQLPVAGAQIGDGWYAVMYKDVFQVMDENFKTGRDLMDDLGNFNTELNDNDIGTDYVDEQPFSYTRYEKYYGEFRGTSKKK